MSCGAARSVQNGGVASDEQVYAVENSTFSVKIDEIYFSDGKVSSSKGSYFVYDHGLVKLRFTPNLDVYKDGKLSVFSFDRRAEVVSYKKKNGSVLMELHLEDGTPIRELLIMLDIKDEKCTGTITYYRSVDCRFSGSVLPGDLTESSCL